MDEEPVTVLDKDASWAILARHEFGRLAYHLDGRVHIAPVNYGLDGDRVLFRTAAGSKLAGALGDEEVAFEVDEVFDHSAVSVIVRGRATELSPQDARWSDQVRLRPWTASFKDHVVAIEATEVSGRRFALDRPWMSMIPRPRD